MSTIQQIQASRESFANGQKFYAANNFDDALREFRRAVQLQEVVFGKYHKETIRSYLGHGKAALMLERQTLALQSFQRAMRMANVSFAKGLQHDLCLEIQTCWHQVHNQDDDSLLTLKKIFEKEDLGDKAVKKDQHVKAIEYYCEALSLQDALVGKDSLDGADIRYKLGSCLLKTKATPQAKHALQLAYKCYVDQVGKDHPATMGCVSKMNTIVSPSA